MIVRPQQHWFTRLFVWHGSVLEKIFSRLLLNVALSLLVIFILPWYETLGVKLTMAPFSVLGVAIAIFLGFRNNACYARYNEARHLWGELAYTSRTLLRQIKTLTDDDVAQQGFINLQLAFCHSLRQTLRGKNQPEILSRYLSSDDLAWVTQSHAPANRVLMLMGEWINHQRQNGKISDIVWQNLDSQLSILASIAGGCERILYTPLPFAYSLILHRTVYIFCILLPFALVIDLHYMTPFVSVFISYTFIALDTLAEELEDPFGLEDNDLPLDALCTAIERDLRDMNDDADKPAGMRPNKYYRLS